MKRHSVNRRNELLVSSAALIGCVSITNFAHAQSAQPSSRSTASGDTLEEIVVTTQKRSQKMQDVPLSITVVTSQDLEKAGVTTNLDLTQLVPGLKMDRIAGFTNPAIRGVTTSIDEPGADPNVATYIDGIYQSNPAAGTFDLPDVQRIDVAKGPQGTLFGRNATGGAIQIFTLDPSDTLTGHLGFSYASFNDQTVKAYIAGPIIAGKVFASISGFEETADSYYRNIGPPMTLNGISSHTVRAKIIAQPSDDLKVTFIGFWGRHGDASAVLGNPLNGISVAHLIPGSVIPTKPYDVAGNFAPEQVVNGDGASVKAEYNSSLGAITLTSSYNHVNTHLVVPTADAYVPGGLDQYYFAQSPADTYQVELGLASVEYGPFSYIGGVNYYNDSQSYAPLVVTYANQGVATIYAKQTSHAISAFGEATYELTNDLSAILGARYSLETRTVYGNLYLAGLFGTSPPNGWVQDGQKTFVSTTPRFSLRYRINSNTNIYFTYSEGFKSGLFDAASVPLAGTSGTPALVQPEKLKSYEIGIKSAPARWFNFDAATFRYKYSNQQLAAYHVVNGLPLGTIQNAAASTIYGADLEGNVKPVPQLTLHAGISLLHTQYDSFPNASVNLPAPGDAGNINFPANATGNTLERAPKWTATFSGTYAKDFEIGHASLTASVYHSEKIYYDFANFYFQKAYTDLGFNGAIQPAAIPGLTLSVYGKNLTDNKVILGAFIQSNASAVSWAPPRTFGFNIACDF
jgi:iron complex outermembrane receptor protein